jgi:hypothetical protein
VEGQPDRTGTAWKVAVRQPGIAARAVTVAEVID